MEIGFQQKKLPYRGFDGEIGFPRPVAGRPYFREKAKTAPKGGIRNLFY